MISILLPSRNRVDNVKRLIESGNRTATTKLEWVIRIDDDDPQIDDYKALKGIKLLTGPRDVLSKYWNECQQVATNDIYMHCGDDIVFQTPGWDEMVLAAFDECEDKILFVHGLDGIHDAAFGTHGFIHKRWVDIQGYFVPPYYASDYNDTHLNDIANMINRRLFIPFMTEHFHFVNGKAPLDQTHRERLERHNQTNVDQLYHQPEKLAERRDIAERLRKVLQ